jgi:hypothetical protein
MYCADCGKHLDDDVRFCDACGTPVAAKAEAAAEPAPEPAVAPDAPSAPRRGRRRASLFAAAAGAVGLVAVVALLVQGLGGSSAGAADPVSAVERLAEAANREDPAAALAVVDPREAATLTELYGKVRDSAVAAGTRAMRPDGGIADADVELDGLRLDAEELGDGVTKVHVSGGTLRARLEATGVPSALGLEEDARARVDLARVAADSDAGLFVLVREHDGRWFVSPALTALQYLVELEDLPEPDWSALDEPVDEDGAQDGPRTGERLLQQAAEAISARNVTRLIELAASDEAGPLRAYRSSLEALSGRMEEQLTVAVTSSDVTERNAGDSLVRLDLANVQASGTVESYDDFDSATVTLNGLCVAVDDDQQTCNENVQRIFGITRFFVMAERDGEQLRVSPSATLLAYGQLMIDRLGPEGTARVLGLLPRQQGRELEAGETVTGELSDAGIAVHPYRADGEQYLAVDSDRQAMVFDDAGTRIDAVGCIDRSSLYHLPAAGGYRVAVATFAYESASYRVSAQPLEVKSLPVPGSLSGAIPRAGRLAAFKVTFPGDATVSFTSRSNVGATFTGPLHDGGSCYDDLGLMGPRGFVFADDDADELLVEYSSHYDSDAWLYEFYDAGEYLLLVSGAPGTRFNGTVQHE